MCSGLLINAGFNRQESLRRNEVALIVNKKKSEMQYLDAISKMTE